MISVVVIFLAFALIHSVTVAWWFKQLCARLVGETFMRVWYRFFYTVVSVITTVVAFALIEQVPDTVLWKPPAGVRWYLYIVQIGAVVFGAGAFQFLDGLEFLGIRQVWRYLKRGEVAGNSEGVSQKELVTSGVYGVVRHPLYLAGMIIVTFNPNFTANSLMLRALIDLYFFWGMLIEERRFIKIFGIRYREYMKQVPRMIPRMMFDH